MKKLLLAIGLCTSIASARSQTNTFPTNGNVGIGTTIPQFKVDVDNSTSDYSLRLIRNSQYNNWMYMNNNNTTGASGIRFTNDIGIGLQMMMGGSTNYYFPNEFAFDQIIGSLAFSSRVGFIDFRTIGPYSANSAMRILNNGNVGIGLTSPAVSLDVNGTTYSRKMFIGTPDANTADKIAPHALAVNGSAIFTKAIVKLYSTWPDYVFHKDFKLPKLQEIEEFIEKNGHLPEVPTAKEVKENGINLGDNQVILLKKIEELTLIIIDLNKRIQKLEKGVE